MSNDTDDDEPSKVDGLTMRQRRERNAELAEISAKIKAEYGDALAVLGYMPVIERVWDYTVADHVAHALSRGIELNERTQEIQRDWLNVLRGASIQEQGIVVRILSGILEVHDIGWNNRDVLSELITVLSHAEVSLEHKEKER